MRNLLTVRRATQNYTINMPGSKYFLLNNHKIPWAAYDPWDFFSTFVPDNEPLKRAGGSVSGVL